MKEAIGYLAFIPPIMILLVIIVTIIYNAWYRKNYITTDATDKYARGWHKCWKCKCCESEMYFTQTIHGRIYKCLKCTKEEWQKENQLLAESR